MKCADCPHLKILYMPLRDDNAIWDFGKAHCIKHDLYTDFGYKGKFNKMECVEEDGTLEQLKSQTDTDEKEIQNVLRFKEMVKEQKE